MEKSKGCLSSFSHDYYILLKLVSGPRVRRNYKTKTSNPEQAQSPSTWIHNTQHHWAPLAAANFLFNPQVLRKPFPGLRELESRFVLIVRLSMSDRGEIRFLILKSSICDPREGARIWEQDLCLTFHVLTFIIRNVNIQCSIHIPKLLCFS